MVHASRWRRLLGPSSLRLQGSRALGSSRERDQQAFASWNHAVTPQAMQQLMQDGYCVLPGAFPVDYARRIREEIAQLHEQKQLYANATHVLFPGAAPDEPTLLSKHHVLETELVLSEIRDRVPTMREFFEQKVVFQSLQQALPEWLAMAGYMIKVQFNEGQGGCFPLHFDTYGDDGKCITAVLYLNEDWQQGDGGEVVLYPFPGSQRKVVVPPRAGDMVLFSSQQMLHRVMPSNVPRYCLTTWIYHAPTPEHRAYRAAHYTQQQMERAHSAVASPSSPNADAFDLMMQKVVASTFRRHLMKLLYQDEWALSLEQSHQQTPAFRQYMATHEHEVSVIRQATDKMLSNFRAKDPSATSNIPGTSHELIERLLNQHPDIPFQWF